MKVQRIAALTVSAAVCLSLLTACGTSHLSDVESEQNPSEDWTAEISTVTTAQTIPPEVSPSPSAGGIDVTAQYQDQFVGLWKNEAEQETWHFRETGALVITEQSSEEPPESCSYWIEEDGGEPLLYIFENGDEDADTYTFAFSGGNLTLYDPVTGEAEESLTWWKEVEETPTPAPEQTAAPTQAAQASPIPTEAPTQAPQPSTVPTEAPTQTPETPPEPTTEIELPADIDLPTEVNDALPAVECALDAVLDGIAFDPAGTESFWAVMGRYLSRLSNSDDDGFFTVSEDRVSEAAKTLFADFDGTIPDPSGSKGLAEKTDQGYHLLWGVTGGHSMEVTSYDGGDVMELLADGESYRVTLRGGAVAAIERI